MRSSFIHFLFLFSSFYSIAQVVNHNGLFDLDKEYSKNYKSFQGFDELNVYDSNNTFIDSGKYVFKLNKQTDKIKFGLYPLYNLSQGIQMATSALEFPQTFGYGLGGGVKFGKKFCLDFTALDLYGKYPVSVNRIYSNSFVTPGYNVGMNSKFGVRSPLYRAVLNWRPSSFFLISAGRSRFHWGEGYRSLMLSNSSNDYEFFKITANVWRFKYENLYTRLRYNPAADNSNFNIKYAAMHRLQWNMNKWFKLSIFESVVWQKNDKNINRGIDPAYLNPVVLYRPVEWGLGSADNALMGIGLDVKFSKNIMWYNQVIVDEFHLKHLRSQDGYWANKQGFQSGIKLKKENKGWKHVSQCEFNLVRPYTYSHYSSAQNFGHENFPLAHPSGANFYELVGRTRVNKGEWYGELKFNYLLSGLDSGELSMGSDINKSYNSRPFENGHFIAQGESYSFVQGQFRVARLFHKQSRSNAFLSMLFRKSLDDFHEDLFFLQIGVETSVSAIVSDI